MYSFRHIFIINSLKTFKTADVMAAHALSETSKRFHISARLVKSCWFCMFGCLARGENSEEAELEAELLNASSSSAASDLGVDG